MFVNRTQIVLLLVIVATITTTSKQAYTIQAEKDPKPDQPLASEPTNLLVCTIDGLSLYSIPAMNDSEQEIEKRKINRILGAEKILGAYKGHLLTLTHSGHVLLTNLTNSQIKHLPVEGAKKIVAGVYQGKSLYLVAELEVAELYATHSLVHVDLENMKVTRLCSLSGRLSSMRSRHVFKLAASPDGSQVAVSEIQSADQELSNEADRTNHRPPVRIVIAKPGEQKTTQTAFEFSSKLTLTGAGFDNFVPPSFAWMNEEILLVTSSKTKDLLREVDWRLKKVDTRSGNIETFLEMPSGITNWRFSTGQFAKNVLDARRKGTRSSFTVDTENRSLIEVDLLSNRYPLNATEIKGSFILEHEGEILEAHTKPERVFPSHDGQRVAWFALRDNLATIEQIRKNDHGTYIHDVGVLKVYDSVNGVRSIGEDHFTGAGGLLCLWLRDEELQLTDAFESLPIF